MKKYIVHLLPSATAEYNITVEADYYKFSEGMVSFFTYKGGETACFNLKYLVSIRKVY